MSLSNEVCRSAIALATLSMMLSELEPGVWLSDMITAGALSNLAFMV